VLAGRLIDFRKTIRERFPAAVEGPTQSTSAGDISHIVSVIEPNIIAAASESVIANSAKRAAILGAGGPDERRAKAGVL